VHLDLDGAWGDDALALARVDARHWGPRVRCYAPRADAEALYANVLSALPPFVLYGSGDFHHLAALLLRRVTVPLTVVSFDNHPDWDIRPPHWACGGWVNRALELPNVRRVSVWGCGNFELSFPHRLFANRRAVREGRLEVHAWAERQPQGVQKRFACMQREGWRDRFDRFASGLAGQDVYVTIDLDCLQAGEAVTNWENGMFTAEDIAWALSRLRQSARLSAGDVCGAYSRPAYARWRQRFAAEWDRPRQPAPDPSAARAVNLRSLSRIWPALTGGAPAPSPNT
jgi:arginase family enzyme